jgi:hypothetical protein
VLLVLSVVAAGNGLLALRSLAAQQTDKRLTADTIQQTTQKAEKSNEDGEQAEPVSFRIGETVHARFFLKNAEESPIKISYPRRIAQGYYKALRLTDGKGREFPVHKASELPVVGGWLGGRLAPGECVETDGLSLTVGNGAAKESVETVLGVKSGQTYRLQFTSPN